MLFRSAPPAMPTTRKPLSLATWPTTEPTAPDAARGETLISRYYTFADEFQAILHRKVHTSEE